jgi:FkbM family methyltransferase
MPNVFQQIFRTDRYLWLFRHPTFRKRPVRTTYRVMKWEIFRRTRTHVKLPFLQFKLKVRPFDGMGRLICYFGEEADDVFAFMKGYLRTGMNVVDVGANIGTHAILAAQLVSPSGKVLAFEAHPHTAAVLHENLQLNQITNVEVRQQCVSDHLGLSEFNIGVDSAKNSMVRKGARAVEMPTDKLDNLIPQDFRIDLLKIDVEGADYFVLMGAVEILAGRPPPVIVLEASENQREISALLSACGYRLYAFAPDSYSFIEVTSLPFNVYAIHASVVRGVRRR